MIETQKFNTSDRQLLVRERVRKPELVFNLRAKSDKEKVIGELNKLKRNGVILPQDVVEHARKKNNPLHELFEWDNTIAAEKFRLAQARYYLHVTVSVINVGNTRLNVPTFVSLTYDRKNGGSGGYRPLVDVLNDEELYEEMKQDAITILQNVQEKYSKINELELVFSAIDKTIARRSKKKIGKSGTSG